MNEYIRQYEELAAGIVKQAVVDYKKASRQLSRLPPPVTEGQKRQRLTLERQIAECKRFFRSGWFTQLSNLDGEALMDILDKTVK